MKSKTAVVQKLRSLRKLLDRAEDNYTQAIGLRDEGAWRRRCTQLETQIDMLEWVLAEAEPKKKKKKPKPPEPGYIDPVIKEYGAHCNPKRHGK